jgi:hypothetical protein
MGGGLSIVARNPNPQPGGYTTEDRGGRVDAMASSPLTAQPVSVQAVTASAQRATTMGQPQMGQPQMGHASMMTPTMGATALQAQPVRPILRDEMAALRDRPVGERRRNALGCQFVARRRWSSVTDPVAARGAAELEPNSSGLLPVKAAAEQVAPQALQVAAAQAKCAKALTLFEKMTSRLPVRARAVFRAGMCRWRSVRNRGSRRTAAAGAAFAQSRSHGPFGATARKRKCSTSRFPAPPGELRLV